MNDDIKKSKLLALKEKYQRHRLIEQEGLNFMRKHNFQAEAIVAHARVEVLDDFIIDLDILLSDLPI